jgi:hypothetical protein
MKTNHVRTDRLILVLGFALVAGGIMAAATYQNLERQTHSAEVLIATCGRLNQDLQLCAALRAIREGDVNRAARRLDLKLCEDIVAINSQLASTDAGDREFIKNAFARISLTRPKSARLLTGATQGLRSDQIEAERILAQAGGGTVPANEVVAASP